MSDASKFTRRGARSAEGRDETGESLVAGLAALLESGRSFHEMSVSEISKSAGVTRSAFYFYFANKAEALSAAAERYRPEMERAAAPFVMGEEADDFHASMALSLRQVAETWGRQRSILHAMIDASVTDPQIDEAWQDWMLSFREPVLDRIQRQASHLGVQLDDALAYSTVTRLLWMNERNLYRLHQREMPSTLEVEDLLRGWAMVWRSALGELLRGV